MGDDDGGLFAASRLQGFDDGGFRFVIDGAEGVVEEEDGWIAQESAGDCDALALSPGEGDAFFADLGFVSVGEVSYGIVDTGHACRFFHF